MRVKRREISVYATSVSRRHWVEIRVEAGRDFERIRRRNKSNANDNRENDTIVDPSDNSASRGYRRKKAPRGTGLQSNYEYYLVVRRNFLSSENDRSSYLSCRTLGSVENLGERFQLTRSREI